MQKQLFNTFEKPFITIDYVAGSNWVYNNWMGYLSVNNVIDGANACLEVLADKKCSFLLNDNRLVVGSWDQATDWIATDWTPRAIAIGLQYFAHVVSPESFAEISAKAMNELVSGSFTMRIFHEMDEAKSWLRQNQGKAIQLL